MARGYYGYPGPKPAPSPEPEEEEDDDAPEARVAIAGSNVEVKSITIDNTIPYEAFNALSVAVQSVERAIGELPAKMPAPLPTDMSSVTDALSRLAAAHAALADAIRASEAEDEGIVTQTVERDARGNVLSIVTKKGGKARRRVVERNREGYIVGTVEK